VCVCVYIWGMVRGWLKAEGRLKKKPNDGGPDERSRRLYILIYIYIRIYTTISCVLAAPAIRSAPRGTKSDCPAAAAVNHGRREVVARLAGCRV